MGKAQRFGLNSLWLSRDRFRIMIDNQFRLFLFENCIGLNDGSNMGSLIRIGVTKRCHITK